MGLIKDVVLSLIKNWFEELIDKILEDPIRNSIVLFVSIAIMYAFAQHFFEYFSIMTLIGYIFLCLKGITRIIDDPRRTITWAVGIVIGAIASQMIFENLIPALKFRDLASIISAIFIAYVIISFFIKSEELKSV